MLIDIQKVQRRNFPGGAAYTVQSVLLGEGRKWKIRTAGNGTLTTSFLAMRKNLPASGEGPCGKSIFIDIVPRMRYTFLRENQMRGYTNGLEIIERTVEKGQCDGSYGGSAPFFGCKWRNDAVIS